MKKLNELKIDENIKTNRYINTQSNEKTVTNDKNKNLPQNIRKNEIENKKSEIENKKGKETEKTFTSVKNDIKPILSDETKTSDPKPVPIIVKEYEKQVLKNCTGCFSIIAILAKVFI